MHRELSHADAAFARPRLVGLVLFTSLLAVLLILDLLPPLADWLAGRGYSLPHFGRELFGQRFALIAAILGGARALYGAVDRLLDGQVGADLALAIACVAAILIGEPLVAAEVVVIGLVGECLEAYTFARTQDAVRRLAEVFPQRCWVLRDGQEVRVFTHELQAGDRVVVKPGAKVPADGDVTEGRSAVDTSALTGESLPRDVGPGDAVLAGSVNQFGALTITIQRVGEQTVAGRVIELTARALRDKSPTERTADRMARWFLPVVLALAALTFVVALAIHVGPFRPVVERLPLAQAARLSAYPALAVLVVACPCALILATPAAVVAALGRLAGTGVLVKGGSALERLAGVRAFAFDKTGTLTEGKLELGDVVPIGGAAAEDLLRSAATAEQSSEHPVARMVLAAARERGLEPEPPTDFSALPGFGVRAVVGGHTLLVGTRRLLVEQGVPLPPDADAALDRLAAAGQTPLLVARDGLVLGILGARDRVRPNAASVIAELRALGISDIALLTGDRAAVANAVAAELGITEVHAELLPDEKASAVGSEQWALGNREDPSSLPTAHCPLPTAFVGDGLNDAPALARATVGLAVGGGADVAAEAGDVVLMGDPLAPLPLLVKLSRETVRIIRQNIIAFAFGVNLVGIVLTAWLWPLLAASPAWYESAPLAGAIYHQLGSLAVLLNSMRLLAFDRRPPRALAEARAGLQRFDHWLARTIDLDEWLHALAHRWKSVAASVACLAGLAYGLSGLTAIVADEVGVVRRFGRVLPEDLPPGLHWRWPWPAESVSRVQPDRVRAVEVGYRRLAPAAAGPGVLTWASVHGDDVRRIPDEALMVTGEGNLVELLASVRYRANVPREYLTAARDPDELLRSAAEAVLREEIAGRQFAELLTVGRSAVERAALDRLRARVAGLGVELEAVALHDLHPPAEVVESYHGVARAAEARDKLVNDAHAAATRTVREAEAKSLRAVRDAEAAAADHVSQARAALDSFAAWCDARQTLDVGEEARLAADLFGRVFAGQSAGPAYAEYLRQRQHRREARARLIDARLAWDAITRALADRPKVIVDTDKLPGRRQILMFDPGMVPPAVLPRGGRGD